MKTSHIPKVFFFTFLLVVLLAAVFVMAAVAEGTATIGGGATQNVEISSSTVFTTVLTVGVTGIATDADSPTFTIPTGFTAPHASGGASVPTQISEVDVAGEWFAAGSGGTCAVTMGSSSATGQVITIDVTGACAITDTITLTYNGTASGTASAAAALNIATDDASGGSAATNIASPPTIAVYGAAVFADHANSTIATANNLVGLANVGGTDVVLGGFKITAAGEDAAFTNLRTAVTLGTMVIGEFTNLRIVPDDGTGSGDADDGIMHADELAAPTVTVASPTVGNNDIDVTTLTVSGTVNFFIVGTIAGAVSDADTLEIEVTGAGSTSAGATSSITITSTGTSDNSERTITDTTVPVISAVSIPDVAMKVGDVVTVSITVDDDTNEGQPYTLTSGTIGGFTLGSLTRNTATNYTATFTITDNGANVAAGSTIPIADLILTDTASNPSATWTTAITQASDAIDANLPVISAVSIPDVAMKVGDVVTASITVDDDTVDGGQPYTLTSGTIGGFTLGSLTRNTATNYTATFTVAAGGTDVAAGSTIPIADLILTDTASNPSATWTTAITQASDAIDANLPQISTAYPTNTSYVTALTQFNFTYTEVNCDKVWYSNDSGVTNYSEQACTSNFTGMVVVEGLNTWVVYMNDTVGNENSSTVSFTIDTISPLVDFGTGTAVDNANVSVSNVYINASVTEASELNITFRLYNTTGAVNTTTYTDATHVINWTGLSDGNYTYNFTVADTLGNINSTATRTITLDTVDPVVTFSCSPTSVSAGATITCTCSGTDAYTGVDSTTYTASPSTSTAGTFSTNCTVADYARNSAVSSVSYTVTSTSSSSGGGGYPTYSPSIVDLFAGYDISLGKGYKVNFNLAGQSHALKVDSILGDKVMITVSSTPVTFELISGQTEKVDVDDDGIYDLDIYLKGVSIGRANVILTSISEKVPGEVEATVGVDVALAEKEPIVKLEEIDKGFITGNAVFDVIEGNGFIVGLIIFFIILVVVIIAYWKKIRKQFLILRR